MSKDLGKNALFLIIYLCSLFHQGLTRCYIGVDYQGDFYTQVSSKTETTAYSQSTVQYSRIVIQADAIPIWGTCHKKMGQTVILKESTTEGDCYRCIHLQYRSPNVLEIFSKGLNKCFVHESLAMQSCPSETQIRIGAIQEMMLFRSSDEILEQFCPFQHGHYQFTYTKETGAPFASDRCPRTTSKASNCPSASDIELHFQGCSFTDKTVRFKCLGDWRANETGEKFLALLEIDPNDESGPKYRCGLFHEDEATGRAALTLSSDSTCQTNLYSASMGFESLQLRALPERPWPVVVRKGSCRFPEWSQGRWKDLSIAEAIMKHQSDVDLQTYSSHCIQQSNKNQNRFLIYSRSNCGSSQYNCVWFEQRGVNILEYQLGLRPSTIPNSELCDNDNFLQRTWNTQPKRDFLTLSSCPIAGDYTGILPDNPNFCAKLSSDCNNPDVMFYSVSSCDNQSQVLEDREYQCLGQWEEDGQLFTYTKRRDVPGYECFIGSVDQMNGIYLIEGGVNCRRGLRVTSFGMKLTKKSNCYGFPSTELEKMRPKVNDTPWFTPTIKHPTNNPTHPGRTTHVITENDLVRWSNKPWTPIREPSSSSAFAFRSYWIMSFISCFYQLLRSL